MFRSPLNGQPTGDEYSAQYQPTPSSSQQDQCYYQDTSHQPHQPTNYQAGPPWSQSTASYNNQPPPVDQPHSANYQYSQPQQPLPYNSKHPGPHYNQGHPLPEQHYNQGHPLPEQHYNQGHPLPEQHYNQGHPLVPEQHYNQGHPESPHYDPGKQHYNYNQQSTEHYTAPHATDYPVSQVEHYTAPIQIGLDNIKVGVSVFIDKMITPGTVTNSSAKDHLFSLIERIVDEREVGKVEGVVSDLSSLISAHGGADDLTELLLEALDQLTNYLEKSVPSEDQTQTQFSQRYDEQTLEVFVQRESEATRRKLVHNRKYACWLDPANSDIVKMKRMIITKADKKSKIKQGFAWDNEGIIFADLKSSFHFVTDSEFIRFKEYLSKGKINTLPTPRHHKFSPECLNSIIMKVTVTRDNKKTVYHGCSCEFTDHWLGKQDDDRKWLRLKSEELMPKLVGENFEFSRKGHKWGNAFSKEKILRLDREAEEKRDLNRMRGETK